MSECTKLLLVVRGIPVAQPRANATVVGKRSGNPRARMYTPDNGIRAWKREVLAAARALPDFPKDPWDGAVRVSIEAFFERPQSLMRAKDPAGPIRKNSTPDADNVAKAVLDALTPPKLKRITKVRGTRIKIVHTEEDVAAARRGYLWIDDAQVHLGPIDRWYAAKDAAPGVIANIERIPEGE